MSRSKQSKIKDIANMMAFVGGTLQGQDDQMAEDNPNKPFGCQYGYQLEDYQSIINNNLNEIYRTNNIQGANTVQGQMVPQQYYQAPPQQFDNHTYNYNVPVYQQQFQNNIENTTVDISKYIGKKKEEPIVRVDENSAQLHILNKANEPILAKLEGMLEILGLIYQEQVKTNNLLRGSYEEMAQDAAYDEVLESDIAVHNENQSIEEEIANLDALSQSLTPQEIEVEDE